MYCGTTPGVCAADRRNPEYLARLRRWAYSILPMLEQQNVVDQDAQAANLPVFLVLVMSLGPPLPSRYSNPKTPLQVTAPAEGQQDLVVALVD